jgi:hypothetical protein
MVEHTCAVKVTVRRRSDSLNRVGTDNLNMTNCVHRLARGLGREARGPFGQGAVRPKGKLGRDALTNPRDAGATPELGYGWFGVSA